MSRGVLIQQGSKSHRELIAATSARHSRYAARHDLDFICITDSYDPAPFDIHSENKAALLHYLLNVPDGQKVVMLDADTVVKNLDADPLGVMPPDCQLAMLGSAWGHYANSGVMMMVNSPELRGFWQEVFAKGPVTAGNKCIDVRIYERLTENRIAHYFLPDAWNHYEICAGSDRKNQDLRDKAIILGFHGMPWDKALKEMTAALDAVEEKEAVMAHG
jgi:hypothetical protein